MNAIPNHVAVVPNGHRRWSAAHGVPLPVVYVRGAMRVLRVAKWAKAAGVKQLTCFGLSCENLENRPEFQLNALMKGADVFLDHVEKVARVHVFGQIDAFQDDKKYASLYARLKRLNEKAYAPDEFVIHAAVNYSGLPQHELAPFIQALRSRGFPAVQSDSTLMRHLLSGGVPPIDLFIRTGGEQRISGFLPFQSSYAELRFTETLWPDFSKTEFLAHLKWFAEQPRNFGK